MIRGLYTSAWSMLANEKKMDVISNNLANVNTAGFKKDTVIFESFPEVLTKSINDSGSSLSTSGIVGNMSLGSDVGEVFTYYNQGQLVRTDSRLDLSLDDSGASFFTVLVPDGNGNEKEYYTRDGEFVLGVDGRLLTKDGFAVEGENGYINLSGEDFTVEVDGAIVQGGEVKDRLLIKEFSDTTKLRKFGSNLVEVTDEAQEINFSGTVRQGFIEQSNVNIIREMVDMITVMRSYEANQKLIQAQDSTLDKAVNEVGALR